MTLPTVTPGTFVHSPELGIEVTTVKTEHVPFSYNEKSGLCKRCVFDPLNPNPERMCGDLQPCGGVIWVDRRTYALLRLTR